jgi:hypothetical protein
MREVQRAEFAVMRCKVGGIVQYLVPAFPRQDCLRLSRLDSQEAIPELVLIVAEECGPNKSAGCQ